MKTWLKGGLIGVGIELVLVISTMFFEISLVKFLTLSIPLLILKLIVSNLGTPDPGVLLVIVPLDILIGFII